MLAQNISGHKQQKSRSKQLRQKERQGFIWAPGKLNAEIRAGGQSLIPSCTNIIPVLLFIYLTALLKCN